MLRIGLFLLTNLAVMVLVGIIFNLLGIQGILDANGVNLNMSGLFLMCAIFGIGGSLISLLMSKTIARMSTRTQIITQPRSADEQWLVETVHELAQKAGIGMPEVAIFEGAPNAFATACGTKDPASNRGARSIHHTPS